MASMRFVLFLALVATPLTAVAEDQGGAPEVLRIQKDQYVIGGTVAPADKWPDAAAVQWGTDQGCTGTLIAPTLVATAGHCILGGAPNYVTVGTNNENTGGERIRVTRYYEYPSSQNTVDAAVLVLERPAAVTPRAVATGWAKFDIVNGARVALVGFGTTDSSGSVDSAMLMEAETTITDFNCTTSAGCNFNGRPDGELGAGGMGIDTCPGDSGGPLYVLTPYGSFLAGITSRGYSDNNYYCSEGGIYARADKVVDWMEMMTGLSVTRGPEPRGEMVTAVRGNAGETQIVHNDPLPNTSHTYAIVKQPEYGKAAISDSGVLRVCPNSDVIGGDTVTVSVTDSANPTRTLQTKVGILIEDGDPADECDETDFGNFDGGGCCDTRRSASGSLLLALAVGLFLVRRRRRS